MGMLILKIILSVLAAILLLDVVINLFAGSRASDITNSLCRPLFGLLYPQCYDDCGVIYLDYRNSNNCFWNLGVDHIEI